MQINNINNVNFSGLHINPTLSNRIAVEKFLSKNPEATKELFSEIDRESGDSDVYFNSSFYDSGNIDVSISDKGGRLYTVKRIGLGSPENLQRSFEKLVNVFTRITMVPKPEKPAENKEVSEILNKYV